MRKLMAIILTGVMAFAMAACGTEQEAAEPETEATETEQAAETVSGGDAIVVYYSASGNTKRAAEIVAKEAGAELFELIPTEQYTEEDLDWTEDGSRVNKEHEDASLQDIELETTEIPGWENYSTVFIGYPIWWGDAAWPLNNFIKNNDFDGKTIIPFCTSYSSGIGDSDTKLAEMAGSGTWLDGNRFEEDADESEITEWVQGLDLD